MTPLWPHGDPRDVVRAILANSRYTRRPPLHAPQRSWLDDVRDWIGHVIRSIFHTLDRVVSARSPLNVAVGFIVAGIALALLGYCIFIIVRSYGHRPARRRTALQRETALGPERDAAGFYAAALDAARSGRYRDAAGLLFGSAVRALDERGRIAYDAARTPGEYRRIVRDPLFDALAADAVTALFAPAEPRDELFERMIGTYDRFFGPTAH